MKSYVKPLCATIILFLLAFNNETKAQISASFESFYGKEKTMIGLIVDKKANDLVHFGGFVKTGSLNDFHYPTIVFQDEIVATEGFNSSFTFPYGPESSAYFLGGSTRTKGWSIGGYLSLNRSLSRRDKDWFFIRFDLEHLWLKDNYDFSWVKSSWNGMSYDKEYIRDQGTYNYNAIAFATRAGYKRILGKDERLFAQLNLGVCYYHPYYPDPMEKGSSGGYWTGTPFMGVEFEAGAGIGYVIMKKKY